MIQIRQAYPELNCICMAPHQYGWLLIYGLIVNNQYGWLLIYGLIVNLWHHTIEL